MMRLYIGLMGIAVSTAGLGAAEPPAPPPAANPPEAAPHIEFAEPVHDFGEIAAGSVVKHTFKFSNTGSSTLEVTKVNTSCGCTTTGDWDRVVEPGEEGAISIEFAAGSVSGKTRKNLTVISNDPRKPLYMLQITANVWTPIEVKPRSLVFQYDSASPTGETKVVKIKSNLKEPLVLSAPEWSQEAFDVKLEEVVAGKEFALKIRTLPPVGKGTLSAPIRVRTSLTNPASLSVHAMAVERQPLMVSPRRIFLPAQPLTNETRSVVTIRGLSVNPLALSEAAINVPGVEVKLEEVQPGRLFRLTPVFPEGFHLQSTQRVELSVKTSDPRRPRVWVPVVPRIPGRAITRVVPPANSRRSVQSSPRVVPSRRPVRPLPPPSDPTK
jgi:hypothetical protein